MRLAVVGCCGGLAAHARGGCRPFGEKESRGGDGAAVPLFPRSPIVDA